MPAECEVKENSFANTTIGVRSNSFEERTDILFSDKFQSCEMKSYYLYPKLFDELDQGIISAVIMEKLSAKYIVGKSGVKYKIMDENLCDCSYAVGFRLGNTELCGRFNTVLKEMRMDGTAKNISEKWFGQDIT